MHTQVSDFVGILKSKEGCLLIPHSIEQVLNKHKYRSVVGVLAASMSRGVAHAVAFVDCPKF